ncbi:TIM barrel protein, partial [Salmonella enterica]|uniref:TIM barrel protein n=1 Tax=Salmonella enterica TaxID=28901 RepID=UPI00398C24E2
AALSFWWVNAVLETGVAIPSMCLSANSRFPFGRRDEAVSQRAGEIKSKAISLARDLGIRTMQLAGYDVYYEVHDEVTQQRFAEGLADAVEHAAAANDLLAAHILHPGSLNPISKRVTWVHVHSPSRVPVYPAVATRRDC